MMNHKWHSTHSISGRYRCYKITKVLLDILNEYLGKQYRSMDQEL